jgi:hypothetical protein
MLARTMSTFPEASATGDAEYRRRRPLFTFRPDQLHTMMHQFPLLFVDAIRGTHPLLDAQKFGGVVHADKSLIKKLNAGDITLPGAGGCALTSVNFMYMQAAGAHERVFVAPSRPQLRIVGGVAANLLRRGGVEVIPVHTRARLVVAFAATNSGEVRVGVAASTSETFDRRKFRNAALQAARRSGACVFTAEEARRLRIDLRKTISRS